MNKIFKVVWSKTKECYVVVSEVAKNNGGKKKVLASVLAGLAMVSIGQVQAAQTQYGSGSTATGAEATAVGVSSTATKSYATAVGYLNKAEGIASIAAGSNNKVIADAAGVQSDYSYAVGSNNTITGSTYASAFGRENNVVGEGSTALGYNNLVGIDRASGNAIVDAATGAKGAGRATAIGYQSEARGNRNVAIGNQAIAQRDDSVAIGSEVQALSGHNIAIGSKSVAQASTDKASVGIAIGLNVKAVGQSTTDKDLIAIGNSSNATANGAVAIGSLANATGRNSYAMGNNATASASGAVAIGQVAGATGHGATAFGNGAQSYGIGSTGIGRLSYASENGATAIGANSAATGYNSIAIGADEVTGTGNLDYVNNNFKTPGATADTIGSTRASGKYAVALSTEARASKDDAVAIGHKATASIAGGVALGSESKTTKAAGEIGYNPATGRTNDYNKLTNNTKAALTSTRAAVSIGDDSASVTRQLTGLAAGTQDTDAVNVAQLKAVNLKFAGDSTQVTGSTDVRLNDGTFNVNGDGTLISTEATATGIKVKAKVGGTITNDPSNDGKAKAPTTDGIATTTNVTDAINNSGWKVTSSNNGGTTNGTSVEKVSPGDKVTFSAGKNIVLDQNGKQFTYSLSDTVALTNTGSLTVGNTKVNNGGVTITAPTGGSTTNVTLTQSGLDNGGNKIVNVKDGDVSATSKDAVNGSQLHAVAAKERHIAPTTASHAAYTVDNNGDVTLDYVDGDGAATSEKAIIKGVAKQDLSNITNAGKQVITGLSNKVVAGDNVTVDETEDATTKQKTYKVNAKLAKLEDGTNTTVSGNGTAANPYHVNVAGDLTGISSITNGGTNNGKISFGPNKTVTVDGDHSITLNASTGTIGGLQNKTFDPTNITSGQAATEDQLKSVHDTLKASELHIAPTESNRTGEHIAGGATSNTAAGAAANAYKYDATTKQVVLEYNDGTGANKTGTKAVIDFSALNTGAGASSWNIASDKVSTTEGTVAAGSAATQNIADGKTVTMKAGKNLTVKQENVGGNASVAFSLDKDLKDLDSVTTNKTITKEITLKDPNGGTTSTTIKKDGDRITYTNDGSTTVNKVANLADEKHITPGTYSVDNTGKVTMTYTDGNGGLVPNTTTVIDGLVTKKLDNIDNDGKKTITGLGTIVKAGDNVTVSEASDATTGQKTYTVNAVTPAVYTKADGTKVVKRSDGTYTTNLDGSSGNDVAASDVIVSFQDAAGHTTGGNSIVNNVGSAIDKTGTSTGNTFLTKLNTAANDTPNAAVNVKDLKNTSDAIIDKGLKFDANSGGVKTNKLGSTVKVQGAGTSADANYSGANIKTFIDQDTTGNTTIDVKLDKNLTGINSISNTTTGPKMEFGGNSINITGGSLNMGGSNITNLKSGIVNNNATDDTNAANIGDVKKIAKDSDLHIAPTAGTTNNVAEYTVDANNKVTLTYQDGNGTAVTAPKAVIDLSALANKITSGYTFNANATANGGTVANDATTPAAVTAVANGGTINYAAGKNLTVKQDIDTTNKTHTYTYSLDKDINVETVTVTGQNGKDGKIGINGKNGTNGVNGTNRVDIQVEKGVDGIDGKNGTDGISRIVYEDKTGTHTVATMDDGLKFTGNNTVIENKQKLGSLVKVQGEGTKEGTTVINPTTGEKELVLSDGTTKFESAKDNIAVVADGADTLTVKLNKKLKGLDSVQTKTVELGDHTTPGGTTNITYNTGDNRIEYTTPGATPGTTDTKKVATTDDIWTIQGNGTDVKPVNGKVNVKAGENILITTPTTADGSMTINAVTPAVYTDKNGNKLTKDKDGKFHKPDGTEVAAADVITSIQDASGNVTGGNSIVNNVGSAIKGLGSTGDNYLTKLDLANTATPNAAVNVSDLKNTADALKSNELHIRPTTSGRTGETVNKNTAGTAESYKYDAATKSVTLKYNDGTGAGVTGTEAKIDLSGLADQITSGYTFSTNAKGNLADGTTATATAVGNGKTVSFAAGKNLTVEQNINATTGEHTYTYALSDKITAGKDGVNGKDGSVGVTGKDGSSVVINGADGSIGMTGPKGQDGKDGINGRDGANLSMTSAKGEQVLVNRDPAHNADTDKAERIVYVPKDASGNPIQDANGKNIVREVATMDDGLKFTGNNESTENKHKLGSLVKVQGEGVTENTTTNKLEANGEEFKSASGNIAVVADSIDKLTVKLNKNLAGINKISNGGSSITLNDNPSTTTPAVTISGGNLSMGDGTHNNKIVNVAPGTDDSDAVNYKQLKDAKTVLADGKNTKKSGTGTAADPYKVNVEGDLTDITSITNKADASGNAGKITFSPNQTVTVSGDHNITLDAGSGHIGGLTNLTFNPNSYTSGQAATEDQLKFVHDTLKANERHIAPTTVATGSTETKGGTANAAGTANVYKYDAASKTVTLSYNDGNGNAVTDTKAVIDLSNLSTGGTGASSWNIASDKVSATEGAVATGSAGTQNIADGKTVTMKAGKNLTVNQSNDGAGNASVAFSLDKNLENLDKVVVNGNDGATGQAGVSIVGPKGANGVDGNDGKVGIAGKDGKDAVSISGKDGVGHIGLQGPKGTPGTPGADGANLDITTDHGTQTLVKPEANNDNKSERIVYAPKDANGNPLKDTDGNDIKREVATMDDGLKFAGDDGQANQATNANVIKKQLNNVVDIIGGATKADLTTNNIGVNNDGNGKLLVQLSKNLKGLNSIQLGGNTIQSNGDNITFTTNGGTTKTVATTDQLWTIQANGTDVPAKSGKVNLVAGDHITITPDAANGKMTISATGFGSMDGFNVKTSADANGTHAGDTTQNIKNGKTVDMQAGKNLIVTQTNDGSGNTTVNYALNKDVDLGTNGSLKTGDTTINNDGFKNGNTTVGGNGMTIKDPTDPAKTVSLTKDGLNNGGNQITNVASGGNVDTNAANIGDIKRLAKDTRIKDGTYTVDNNGTVELTYVDGAGNQVKDASGNAITAKITGLTTLDSTRVNVAVNETGSGKAVGSKAAVKVTKGTEFVAGDNLIVERKANAGTDVDNSVVYSLNKDLKGIETIKNGNTTITLHNNPTTATDPTAVTITGGNINMGGNRIVNVAPAKDGTDAVNLDQLKAARTKVTSNDGTVTIRSTEDKTTGQMTYDLHVTPGQSPDLTRITNKVDQLGEEIGRVGAQGAALSALKPIQYDPLEPTQIMAGYGNYRGNSAVALGVAHYKNESTLIHGGVSWAGGSSHMMANAGVTWKVGNRDSEAAVADRYRKGPISSAYAMQQEMAAMKAQNAGLKGEVSDLKAENEQMKAQIAAMMAKLGL